MRKISSWQNNISLRGYHHGLQLPYRRARCNSISGYYHKFSVHAGSNLFTVFNMAASGLVPRSKFLVAVAVNHLNSPCLSRLLSSSCIRSSSCVLFSQNCSRTGDLLPGKANCVVNATRHFSLQNCLGKYGVLI